MSTVIGTPAPPAPQEYNPLPGVGDLGRCFNLYERYEAPDRPQLFDLTTGDRTYKWYWNTYNIPDNVAPPQPIAAGAASTEYFASRDEFSRRFSEKVGLEAGYRGFAVEFSEAYSINSAQEEDYSYALLTVEYDSYQLTLDEATPASLKRSIASDELYTSIPNTFTTQNEGIFFRFFSRYGTHYLSSVQCGGRLNYYSRILKSYNYTEQDIKANLNASYEGMFATAKLDAEAAWKSVSKQWFNSQVARVSIKGGDPSVLDAVNRQWGVNHGQVFEQWIQTVSQFPVTRDFRLRPVADVFPVEKRAAIEQAIEAYGANYLLVDVQGGYEGDEVRYGSVQMGLRNSIIRSQAGMARGLLVAFYNRETLALVSQRSFDVDQSPPGPDKKYAAAYSYAAAYKDRSDLIAVLAFWDIQSIYSYPAGEFYAFMRQLGAGAGLDLWNDHRGSSDGKGLAYVLVGIPGGTERERGQERIALGIENPMLGWVYPKLHIDVFLEPEMHEGKILFAPR